MVKNLSYRDKLLELSRIYNVKEIKINGVKKSLGLLCFSYQLPDTTRFWGFQNRFLCSTIFFLRVTWLKLKLQIPLALGVFQIERFCKQIIIFPHHLFSHICCLNSRYQSRGGSSKPSPYATGNWKKYGFYKSIDLSSFFPKCRIPFA